MQLLDVCQLHLHDAGQTCICNITLVQTACDFHELCTARALQLTHLELAHFDDLIAESAAGCLAHDPYEVLPNQLQCLLGVDTLSQRHQIHAPRGHKTWAAEGMMEQQAVHEHQVHASSNLWHWPAELQAQRTIYRFVCAFTLPIQCRLEENLAAMHDDCGMVLM